MYNGEWLNNRKNGIGSLKFADGDHYTGQFCDDKFNGQGTYITAEGKVISGEWVNNQLPSKNDQMFYNYVAKKSRKTNRCRIPVRFDRKYRPNNQYIPTYQRRCPPGCVPAKRVLRCPPGCMPDPEYLRNDFIELEPIFIDRY